MAWTGTTVLVECLKTRVNILFHQCVAIILVCGTWGALLQGGKYSAHVVLSTLAIFPCMTEALVVFGVNNIWATEFDRDTRSLLHICIMGVAFIFAIAGIALGIDMVHPLAGHFTTSHGILGLMFLIFIILNAFMGIFSKFSKTFSGYINEKILKVVHNVLGIFTYIFGIACVGTGIDNSKFNAAHETKAALLTVCSIICIWSLTHSLLSLYKTIRGITQK